MTSWSNSVMVNATPGTPRRALVFAQAFPPQNNPEAIVNAKFALALLDAGWGLEVVTRGDHVPSRHGLGADWEPCWENLRPLTHEVRYPPAGRLGRIVDVAVAALRTGYPLVGCRWAWHAAQIAIARHRDRPFEFVISRSLPDSTHLAACIAARVTGLPLVANWNDPPLFLFPAPQVHRQKRIERRLQEKIVRAAARSASLITFPSQRLANHVCRYLGAGAAKKSAVVPHAAIELENSREAGPRDRFTLCHAGNLFPARNPTLLLEALAALAARHGTAVRFVNVGATSPLFQTEVRRLGLDGGVSWLGERPYLETQRLLAAADVLVAIEAPYAEGIFLPSKFVDYVQTGRPILAVSPREGTLSDLLGAHGGGLAADATSPAAVLAVLERLYEAWRRGSLQQEYGSDRLFPLFSPKTIADTCARLFEGVVGLRSLGSVPAGRRH